MRGESSSSPASVAPRRHNWSLRRASAGSTLHVKMAAPSEQPYSRRRRAVVGAPLVGTPACATDLFGARQQHPGAASGRRDEPRRHARGVSGPSRSAQLQAQTQPQPQQPQQRHVHFASTPVAPVARSRRGETMVRAARSLLVRQGGAPAAGPASARQRAPQTQADHRTALDTDKELSPLRQEIKVCESAAPWWPWSVLTSSACVPPLLPLSPGSALSESSTGAVPLERTPRMARCLLPYVRCVPCYAHQPRAWTHTRAHTPSFPSCNDAVDKYREYARLRGAGDDAGGASQGSPRSVGALVSTSSWQTGTQTTDSAVAHTAATNGGAAAAWQGAGEGARGVKRTAAGDAQQQQPTRSSRRRR